MRSKNSLLFVKTFLLSILVATPFLIKQVLPKKEKLDNSNDIGMVDVIDKNEEESNSKDQNQDSTNSNVNVDVPSLPEEPTILWEKVEDSYFDDALFIGDSRTVGIKEYGKIKNATYFCDTGMSIYNIYSRKISVSGVGKVDIKKLLSTKKYGKIYIMLGINEIGNSLDTNTKKFKDVIQYIRKTQPDAIIIIQANLHVTKQKSDAGETFSNKRIDKYNKKLSEIADNKKVFYLDANEIFDDGKGNMKKTYTGDNVHLYAKYYVNWTNYLKEHAVVIKDVVEEND